MTAREKREAARAKEKGAEVVEVFYGVEISSELGREIVLNPDKWGNMTLPNGKTVNQHLADYKAGVKADAAPVAVAEAETVTETKKTKKKESE